MKKIILIIAVVLALLAGGYYALLMAIQGPQEERISFNNDKVIEIIDKQLEGVDIHEVEKKSAYMEKKSIEEIHNALKNKEITHTDLVAYYLLRIKKYDQSDGGNNAISEINPAAMELAKKLDSLNGSDASDKLFRGIPVLVKENINTSNMPTSAGSVALKDFIPTEEAPVIDKLVGNGAIILGKTNLSEMSNWLDNRTPSGFSNKKGQTHNPFAPLKISASGSSSGSAVAMATDLATVTLGTETVGSIVSPSSVNSVVGFKPTRNGINGEGVIPITKSLDTVGVIAKSVKDAAITYEAAAEENTDTPIVEEFHKDFIKNKRIGIVNENDDSKEFFAELKSSLESMGATVIEVRVDSSSIDAEHILLNDFERDLNLYLTKYNAPIKSLRELIEYNKADEKNRIRYGQGNMIKSLNYKDKDDAKVLSTIHYAQDMLNKIMDDNRLDALVGKDEEEATIPAVAGAPEISVPFGKFDDKPCGATFFAKVGSDVEVLNIAYSFEQNTNKRLLPY